VHPALFVDARANSKHQRSRDGVGNKTYGSPMVATGARGKEQRGAVGLVEMALDRIVNGMRAGLGRVLMSSIAWSVRFGFGGNDAEIKDCLRGGEARSEAGIPCISSPRSAPVKTENPFLHSWPSIGLTHRSAKTIHPMQVQMVVTGISRQPSPLL
jgi:hypothetical protein